MILLDFQASQGLAFLGFFAAVSRQNPSRFFHKCTMSHHCDMYGALRAPTIDEWLSGYPPTCFGFEAKDGPPAPALARLWKDVLEFRTVP